LKIVIIGTVGVPASYGGFETLVENLVKYHGSTALQDTITIICSSKSYPKKESSYLSANLQYIPLNANGLQSILYDIISLFSAAWNRYDVILLLGVSGAIALPFIRIISSACIVTNIDGIEWRRQKWQRLAKRFLRLSERMAVRFSDGVIADNEVIAEYVHQTYGVNCHVIAYGGDHAVAVDAETVDNVALPDRYALSVCRIEPENNVHLIVEAFSRQDAIALVVVGNWNNSEYGREIRTHYSTRGHLFLLDPIYDLGKLKTLRSKASFYVHGHSAGGTNPSLVEAMHFGRPILAFDCIFNRVTTEDKALFFIDEDTLFQLIKAENSPSAVDIGLDLLEVAQRRYTWNKIAHLYFSLLHECRSGGRTP
jgi:glycosyltransferase involved in cell wall biosynthesis